MPAYFRNHMFSVGLSLVPLFVSLFAVSACTIIGFDKWAAYNVKVEVFDHNGVLLSGASVISTDDQEVKTNKEGQAILYYTNGGLHVITVKAEGWETSQSKVNVPLSTEEPVRVYLNVLVSPLKTDTDTFVDTR